MSLGWFMILRRLPLFLRGSTPPWLKSKKLVMASFLLWASDPSLAWGMVGGESYHRHEEAPYLVLVGGCQGSVIAPGVIFTAAHCVYHQAAVTFFTQSGERKSITDLTKAPIFFVKKRGASYLGMDVALVFFDYKHPQLQDFKLEPVEFTADSASSFDELWLYTHRDFINEEEGWVGSKGQVEVSSLLQKKAAHERFLSGRYLGRRILKLVCLNPLLMCVEPKKFESTESYCGGDSGSPLIGYRSESKIPYLLGHLTGGLSHRTGPLEEPYTQGVEVAEDLPESVLKSLGEHPDLCSKVKVISTVRFHKRWMERHIEKFHQFYERYGSSLFEREHSFFNQNRKIQPVAYPSQMIFDGTKERIFVQNRFTKKWLGYQLSSDMHQDITSLCEGKGGAALNPKMEEVPILSTALTQYKGENRYLIITSKKRWFSEGMTLMDWLSSRTDEEFLACPP